MKETGLLSRVFFKISVWWRQLNGRSCTCDSLCVWGGGEPVQNYTLFSAWSIVCELATTTWGTLESLRLCARCLRYMDLYLSDVIFPVIKWQSNMMVMVFCRTRDMLVQFGCGLFSFSVKYPVISNHKHWNGSSGFLFYLYITTVLLRCQHICWFHI